MKKVVVLGGAGGIGSVAVSALATMSDFGEITVADVRVEEAQAVVRKVGDERLRSRGFDATSAESLAAILSDQDVVCNCVGPFYRFGPPILEAAIEAGVDYVDVCDDLEPTRTMLDLDGRAKEKGVKALVGMGNSPGLANVFVKLVADGFLDEVQSAHIMHIHGGEPIEGPAVVKHRIKAMVDPVPLFIDGEFIEVMQLEEDGVAHTIETDFHRVGRYPVFPYPHPETITLPKHIPGLKQATNRGVIFPLSYFELTQDMVRTGACTYEPLQVSGKEVVPIDFSVSHILSRRSKLLLEAGIKGPAGCLKVEVGGLKNGLVRSYVFQLSSSSVGAGEGTGIPAAAGAALMGRGSVQGPGVLPPEAAVQPLELLLTAFNAGKALGASNDDSIVIEQIDEHGAVTVLPLPF